MSTQAFRNLTTRLAERINSRPDNNYSVQILTLIERLERLAGGLEKLRDNKNPTDTPEAHSRKVANMAKKLQGENTRINAQINEIIVTGTRELYQLIDEQSGLVESDYGPEIRAAFRSMVSGFKSTPIFSPQT
jgi:hypothetical protein